jgi:hypothetical protein
MSLPPLIHLSTARLASLSLDDPADPIGVAVKRDRAGNELDAQGSVSIDETIDRFVYEFGQALKTVKAVAEATEKTIDAERIEAAVKAIVDERNALRQEHMALYESNDVRDVLERFAVSSSGGHKAVLANYELLRKMGRQHKNKEIVLSKEERESMAKRFKAFKAFIESGRYARAKEIEERLENVLAEDKMPLHAKAALGILSAQKPDGRLAPRDIQDTWMVACELFDAGAETSDVVEASNFAVWILNNPKDCGGQVRGYRWLQDLRFQRTLLNLGRDASKAKLSHEDKLLSLRWNLNCYELVDPSKEAPLAHPYDVDVDVRTTSFLLAVETAARRTRRWMGGKSLATKPLANDPEVGLLGWDVMPNLSASHNRWIYERVEAIAKMGGESPIEDMGAKFARRTARRLLMGKHTRKLARIGIGLGDTPGTGGTDSVNEKIEFGLDGAKHPDVDKILKFLTTSDAESVYSVYGTDPLRVLYPMVIRLSPSNDNITLEDKHRLMSFRDDFTKHVALVTWGQRTRVLFKLRVDGNTDFRLVDPLGQKGSIPKLLREKEFGFYPGTGQWMNRAPEDASNGPCVLSAIMRAMVISYAASQPNSIKEDVYRAAEASPSEGVAPLCAIVTALAHATFADDKYLRSEVFSTSLPTMKQVHDAIENSITEDMLFGDSEEEEMATGHHYILNCRLALLS